MRISEIKDLRSAVGRRVRATRDFCRITAGTEGVVDEYYGDESGHQGVMVAWDGAAAKLPSGYRAYDGVPMVRSVILRDGFGREKMGFDETQFLEIVD